MTPMKVAFLEMSERRNQLFTSLVAVTLGIAAIVGVQTIASRSEIEVAHQVDSLGANIMVLPKTATVDNYYKADLASDTLPESYVNRILFAKKEAGLDGVDNLSPKLSMPVQIADRSFTITGILPRNEFMAKAAWSGGVFDTPTSCSTDRKSLLEFSQAERSRRQPIHTLESSQCIIGADLADVLNLTKGASLTVLKRKFSIVDVLPRTGTIDDARIFIHLHTLQKLGGHGRVINAIEIVGCCNEIAAGLAGKLNALLPEAKVVTISQVVATQQKTNQLMHNLTFVFLIVIVLVGGASVANYMYANAHERRREIGTLMALGATPGIILKMFLIKAAVLGVCGGIIGSILGSGLAIVLGPKIAKIPVMPIPSLIGIGIGLSIVLSLLASIFPSLKAAKTDPCVAIQDL